MNYGSLFGDLTYVFTYCIIYGLLHHLNVNGFHFCLRQLQEASRSTLYLVISPRGCPLAHLAHEAFKYYLRVLIMILEKTGSVHHLNIIVHIKTGFVRHINIFSCVLR